MKKSLTVDQVGISHVVHGLTEQRIRNVVLRRERIPVVLEHSIVKEVGGKYIARRVDCDATGFAHARIGDLTKVGREVFLSDDSASRRVVARKRNRWLVEFKHPAVFEVGDVDVEVAIDFYIDRLGQRTCGWVRASEIKAAVGEVRLPKDGVGRK